MKFLRIEILPENDEINITQRRNAQRDLLSELETFLYKNKSICFDKITATFKNYLFFDYPDQEYLKAFIKSAYTNRDGDLYWAGTKYDDFDLLYKKLSEQKFIAELAVEEEL